MPHSFGRPKYDALKGHQHKAQGWPRYLRPTLGERKHCIQPCADAPSGHLEKKTIRRLADKAFRINAAVIPHSCRRDAGAPSSQPLDGLVRPGGSVLQKKSSEGAALVNDFVYKHKPQRERETGNPKKRRHRRNEPPFVFLCQPDPLLSNSRYPISAALFALIASISMLPRSRSASRSGSPPASGASMGTISSVSLMLW
jgi:hypothetical protein